MTKPFDLTGKIALITGGTHGLGMAMGLGTPLVEMEVDDYKQVLEVDLVAPFIMAKHIVPGMIERGGGKVINDSTTVHEH